MSLFSWLLLFVWLSYFVFQNERVEQQKRLEAEEKLRREEEERQARKSRVAAIMARTRGKGGSNTPTKVGLFLPLGWMELHMVVYLFIFVFNVFSFYFLIPFIEKILYSQ